MLSKSLIDQILLGPVVGPRYTQDSPVLPEVWTVFGQTPDVRAPLLLAPFKGKTGGQLALGVSAGLSAATRNERSVAHDDVQLSYVENVVAANLTFDELLPVVLPLTEWWQKHVAQLRRKYGARLSVDLLVRSALGTALSDPQPPWPRYEVAVDFAKVVTLAALIRLSRRYDDPETFEDDLNHASRLKPILHDATNELVPLIRLDPTTPPRPPTPAPKRRTPGPEPLVWLVSLNRPAFPAITRSVPAIKGDAALRLFDIDCSRLTWAVVDSGIDTTHPAFLERPPAGQPSDAPPTPARRRAAAPKAVAVQPSRVREIYDFTQVRRILRPNLGTPAERQQSLAEEIAQATPLDRHEVARRLAAIAADMDAGRAIDWNLVRPLLQRPHDTPPHTDHGTHVAGILAADWRDHDPPLIGVCPTINLIDFRVLSPTLEETEYAIIAALQFIRFLNDQSGYVQIHGVNMSLQIPHDVRNYACGRTPICDEANRLVANGIVVVAAAGNLGFLDPLPDRQDGGYRTVTIADPGNADDVITVGATHRNRPHTYGVSFFSSRGPTGDGRIKPDLVAPGEKIESVLPDCSYGLKDGTSMAAPHVSGAAALLMARYQELVGDARRIKELLCLNATDLGRDRYFQGAGMLDILRALQAV